MVTELERSRWAKLCKAIKAINARKLYAEVAEVAKGRAIVYVRAEAVDDFEKALEKSGIYPLIIEAGGVYTLSVKLSEVDAPIFQEVSL